MSTAEKADIAASFQQAVIDVLVKKTLRAAQQFSASTILLGGGVAANSSLRDQLADQCANHNLRLLVAKKKYCTDNAAMIASLAYHLYKQKQFADLSLEPHANYI